MPPIKPKQQQKKKHSPSRVTCRLQDITNYRPERFALAPGYYSLPSQQQLFASSGKSSSLIIGNKHGVAYWPAAVDISSLALPLAETVFIDFCQIEVYFQDRFKPARGQQLNKRCLGTFKFYPQKNNSSLDNICKDNNTRLISYQPILGYFTVDIPHFTKYNFGGMPKPVEKAVEQRQPVDISNNRRKRLPQEQGNNKFDNRKLFGSIWLEEQAVSYRSQITEESTSRIGDILDCFKDYVTKSQGKLFQKEQKFPIFETGQHQAALEIENRNRQSFGYKNYKAEASNLPALQNFMFSAEGNVFDYKSYTKHKNLTFRKSKSKCCQNRSALMTDIMFADEMSPRYIAHVVCDDSVLAHLRRQLSLYAILFENKLRFNFNAMQEYSPQHVEEFDVDQDIRFQLIKSWLTWTVRQLYSKQQNKANLFNSKTMSALAFRKPQMAIDSLIINNQWKSAQVLPNLEDQYYRSTYMHVNNPNQLLPDLQSIFKQSFQDLNCKEWMLRLSFAAWYFRQEDFIKHLITILEDSSLKQQDNILLLRMFQLWAVQKDPRLKIELIENQVPSIKAICTLWMITNQYSLGHLEEQAWKNSNKNGGFFFKHYRYEVTRLLVGYFAKEDSTKATMLIGKTKNLSSQQITVLKKIILSAQQMKAQIQIQNQLKRDNLLNALRVCLTVENSSDQISQILYELVVHPSVLGTYRKAQIKDLRTLLEHRSQQFSDLITIIAFNGPDSNISDFQALMNIHDGYTRFSTTLGQKIKNSIIAKIEQCLKYWLDRKKDQIKLLKKQVTNMQSQVSNEIRVRQLLKGSDLLQFL